MFSPQDLPRVFAVPLGIDFSRALYDGLRARFAGMDPLSVAEVEIIVNTRRLQRRLEDLFQQDEALFLPKMRLITDAVDILDQPAALSPLRLQLEVAQLVKALIDVDPTLASPETAFDLAASLVDLMAEMQGEGVDPDIIAGLDVSDQSGHWRRSLEFLKVVQSYFGADAVRLSEGRLRLAVEARIADWQLNPPNHPIIVAGSTGSRGTARMIMEAIARLPQGAVILPGVDTEMPDHVWAALTPENELQAGTEDHPQYRFKSFCDQVGLEVRKLPLWPHSETHVNERARLISLSLRPAPVTDQWISEGLDLKDLVDATKDLTLIEAPTPRAEAEAIAARLRQAVEDGQTAALISPDRVLTRQVTAALDRWEIVPDDSAGLPLQLTAPGRFLRHVADVLVSPLTSELLLVLLRHPLTNTGQVDGTDTTDRNAHILHTNALELELRRRSTPFPTPTVLLKWAEGSAKDHPSRNDWVDWVIDTLLGKTGSNATINDHLERHLQYANALSNGPAPRSDGELWKKEAGREARFVMDNLSKHADAGGILSPLEYRTLIGRLLAAGQVRNPVLGHPQVLIWGTLEARVQMADVVILGGMNDGVWPETPPPDPWLNRTMRKDAGLLLPERRIGLSAHDYQQTVCSKTVVLSRAVRSDEAETVSSRWINRLTNLLAGLPSQNGPECLAAMRARGAIWLRTAEHYSKPQTTIPSAPRPSPTPPTDARPKQLSVTQIKTLIRDPYAIYARKVLGLRKLNPLSQTASAPLRGIIVHTVLERFVKSQCDPAAAGAANQLLAIADDVLLAECPWPAVRAFWRARIKSFTPFFLTQEVKRQAFSANIDTELYGELNFPRLNFTLTGYADRIDKSSDGEALIYDYKTGVIPSANQQLHFDKQLLLEAGMVEEGAFKVVGPLRTKAAVYIGLGTDPKDVDAPLKESPPQETLRKFSGLIGKWQDPMRGYTSRQANELIKQTGDYDHLARYGEWDETHDAVQIDVT